MSKMYFYADQEGLDFKMKYDQPNMVIVHESTEDAIYESIREFTNKYDDHVAYILIQDEEDTIEEMIEDRELDREELLKDWKDATNGITFYSLFYLANQQLNQLGVK